MSAAVALLIAIQPGSPAAATPARSAQLVTVASPRTAAVPTTNWACTFELPDGARFRLFGRLDEIPAGWDRNRSRDTNVEGEGAPLPAGRYGMTGEIGGEHFREYQLTAFRGIERFNVNLLLRRGGAGVGYVTRYVENDDREPYTYYAAGLCTSEFVAGPAPERPQP